MAAFFPPFQRKVNDRQVETAVVVTLEIVLLHLTSLLIEQDALIECT